MNPISGIAGGLQTIFGIGQALFSGKGKAQRQLEAQANSFQPNASIMDYYDKALAKYNPNPYSSQQYQQQNNQIQRNLATGINASNDRRSGLMSIAGATQQANDASARAVGAADQASGADLARLGQASGMKTAEEQKKFDMMYNLKAMKAGQAAGTFNSGLKNIFGGLSTLGTSGLSGSGSPSDMQRMPYNPQTLPY